MLTSLPVSFLPSSALSSLVPPLTHPHPQFLCHVALRFCKEGNARFVSRVAVCSKHQRTTAVSKQDLSHLELGHVIDVHQHFHHV